jgi:predicted RNA binding protein YcfA (HicA-like mRNA interferase family)
MCAGRTVSSSTPKAARRVIVPHHNKDLKKGTLASIIEQAGTSTTEFLKLL